MSTFFLPWYYTVGPIVLVLLVRLSYNLTITCGVVANPYIADAILHRVCAQVPDLEGDFADVSSHERFVCFHLGAKVDHPLGIFAPNYGRINSYLGDMIEDLDSRLSVNGYMGGSAWTRFDERGATEYNFICYWRSLEAVHEFACGAAHRRAWDWWKQLLPAESRHLGINHEIFVAEPSHWEAVYINFQPTLLGATTYLKKGDRLIGGVVDDQWLGALVDARKGKLRSSAGRLERDPEKPFPREKHE